jgi:hypothetical protein
MGCIACRQEISTYMLVTCYKKLLASDTLNNGILLRYRSGIPSLPTLSWRKWQPVVLAGYCMPRRRVGGTDAAMGQQWPPWLRSASAAHSVSVLFAVLRGHNCHRGRK